MNSTCKGMGLRSLSSLLPSRLQWLQALCADGALAGMDGKWADAGRLLRCLCASEKMVPVAVSATAPQVPSLVSRVRAGLNTSHPLMPNPWAEHTHNPHNGLESDATHICLPFSPPSQLRIASGFLQPLPRPQDHLQSNPGCNSIWCPVCTSLCSSGYNAEAQWVRKDHTFWCSSLTCVFYRSLSNLVSLSDL